MPTDDDAFDRSVATLDAGAFDLAAHEITKAMTGGDGLTMYFQPGDATRYLVRVSASSTVTVSCPDAEHVLAYAHHDFERLPSIEITFGVERDLYRRAWGHIDTLQPEHPWTAAVWRRLLNHIRELLEA